MNEVACPGILKEFTLDIISLKFDIEDLIGCKVDVITTVGISPYLVELIFKEAAPL